MVLIYQLQIQSKYCERKKYDAHRYDRIKFALLYRLGHEAIVIVSLNKQEHRMSEP